MQIVKRSSKKKAKVGNWVRSSPFVTRQILPWTRLFICIHLTPVRAWDTFEETPGELNISNSLFFKTRYIGKFIRRHYFQLFSIDFNYILSFSIVFDCCQLFSIVFNCFQLLSNVLNSFQLFCSICFQLFSIAFNCFPFFPFFKTFWNCFQYFSTIFNFSKFKYSQLILIIFNCF